MVSLKRITGGACLLLGLVAIATIAAPAWAAKNPSIDKLAAEGAIFTDYYTEASCTAIELNEVIDTVMQKIGKLSSHRRKNG